MKKEIIQTLKIVSLGLVLSAGFAFANTWNTMPSNPTANNVSTLVDVGSLTQVKTGSFGVGPLAVFGTSTMYGDVNIKNDLGGGNLYVSGKVGVGVASPTQKFEVGGNIKISSVAHSNNILSHICSDTNGQIQLCPVFSPAGSIAYSTPGSYSWTVPTDVTVATFKVWGGGGGGGGGGINTSVSIGSGGSGGGAGGYYSTNVNVTPGEVYSITVGSGGAFGTHGSSQSTGYPGGNQGSSGALSQVVKGNGSVIALGNGGIGGGGGSYNQASHSPITFPAFVGVGGSFSGVNGSGANSDSLSPSNTVNVNPGPTCGSNGASAGGSNGGAGGTAYSDSANCESPYSGSTGGIVIPNAGSASAPGGGGGGGSGLNYALANLSSGQASAGANGKVMITW